MRILSVWALSIFLWWGTQPSFGQEKLQTPQQTNEKIQTLAQKAQVRPSDFPIGAGDLLHIDVFDVPDLSRDVRVNASGTFTYPLISGKITASGLTPFRLEQKMEDLLIENGLVSHPQVTVFVKEQYSQPISIVGAVKRPMVYQEIRPTTLLEVLAEAGGIADDAGSTVLITRPARESAAPEENSPSDALDPPGQTQVIKINLNDLLETGDPAYNIAVYGGDVITVPRAGIVYVAGAVTQPGGYVLQQPGAPMNTMKMIALAHGLTGTAKPNDAVILRRDPTTGKTKEIPVKLKKIMDRKIRDVRLYPNDILYVPDSTGKRVLGRTADAAIAITSGLVILRAGR